MPVACAWDDRPYNHECPLLAARCSLPAKKKSFKELICSLHPSIFESTWDHLPNLLWASSLNSRASFPLDLHQSIAPTKFINPSEKISFSHPANRSIITLGTPLPSQPSSRSTLECPPMTSLAASGNTPRWSLTTRWCHRYPATRVTYSPPVTFGNYPSVITAT